jgi:putative SOS response-associated peptidase YedK
MCGRYTIIREAEEISERFAVEVAKDSFKQSFNAAPTQLLPVIANTQAQVLSYFRWGLIPFWAKDAAIGNKMINARAETLAEKPAFKKSLQTRRCLVIADGFYEWKRENGRKQPYRFTLPQEELFAMAGLWDEWKNESGEKIRSFTVITTTANELLEEVHDRMPVILPREAEKAWLSDSLSLNDALHLLRPYNANDMRTYPVSPMVNSPVNNSMELVKPMNSE